MKYYSDVTKKLYTTEKELLQAEKNIADAKAAKEAREKKLKEERAARAKIVEVAIQEAKAAKQKADMLLNNFVKDYGYFHTSYTTENAKATPSVISGDDLDTFVSRLFSFLGEK